MLKKIIIILSLVLALFAMWIVYQRFLLPRSMRTNVKVEYQQIDPGRLILGKKISIRDGIKIPIQKYVVIEGSTPTLIGKVDLGLADNIYRKIDETIYVEEGYFTENILSTERFDTLVDGKIAGSHLRIKLPLPDTIQCFGMQSKEKNIAPFFIGFLPSSDAENQLDTIKQKLVQEGYEKWRVEWFKSLQENLEYTSLTMTNFINEAARISQSSLFTSITNVFEFELDGIAYSIEIQCSQYGDCRTVKRELGQPDLKG